MPALPDELLAGVDIPVLLLEGERSPRIFGVITDDSRTSFPTHEGRRYPAPGIHADEQP